jgi:hypothetical protein
MKLKKAEYYREFVRKTIPQFNLIMSAVASEIADATVKGYTMTTIGLNELIQIYDINIAGDKISTLRNLIVKELDKKGFSFNCEAGGVLKVFW